LDYFFAKELGLMVRRFLRIPQCFGLAKQVPTVFVLLTLVSLAACNGGPRLVNVKGTVQVDGEPVEGVGLLFFQHESSEIVASAKSEAGGSFKLFTNMNPGIPEGKYLVAASWPDPSFKPPKMSMGAAPPDAPDLLNGRYAKTKSDIIVDISSSTPELVIELKKP
jgi:hypothetical protein